MCRIVTKEPSHSFLWVKMLRRTGHGESVEKNAMTKGDFLINFSLLPWLGDCISQREDSEPQLAPRVLAKDLHGYVSKFLNLYIPFSCLPEVGWGARSWWQFDQSKNDIKALNVGNYPLCPVKLARPKMFSNGWELFLERRIQTSLETDTPGTDDQMLH